MTNTETMCTLKNHLIQPFKWTIALSFAIWCYKKHTNNRAVPFEINAFTTSIDQRHITEEKHGGLTYG